MVLTTFGMNGEGNVIWYPSIYDADSELGLTNDGELRYGSGIDVATDNFNTSDSRLWTKLNEAFPDEVQARYIHMRSNGFMTYENIISYYENIADTIGQTFYNEDARIKYINENNKGFIYMCNGSRLEHTKRWISERIKYMDSCFNYGEWLLSSTIRSNVTGEVTLSVKTYSPQWVEISFSDSATGTIKKWCDKDRWYDFTNTIENAVDNNITIRGVTNIMYIQGLEGLNVSSLLVSNAKGLCEIDIHGSRRIQRLELGNNVMLQKLNCKDCTNLGYDDNYKVIDLSKCVNLKYLDLSNTLIGTVQLNENGGALEYLDLTNTKITYLTCNYQEYLPEIKLDNCKNLSSVSVNGCNALTRISLPNSKLATFEVTDCNKLDYIDISYTGYLTKLDLTGCVNLHTLKMQGITNNNFRELDIRSLVNLTNLDISKCFYLNNIRVATSYNALKTVNFEQSGIKTIQFGNNAIPTYLDLTPFKLNNVSFFNCTQVEHIKGINLVASSSIAPFRECTALRKIEGFVSLTGNPSLAFDNCINLTGLPQLDLSRVTGASEIFRNCKKLTYTQMMDIMGKLSNCKSFNRTFYGCSGISHDGWEKALFDKVPLATDFWRTFEGTNIKGQIEHGIFDNLPNLQTAEGIFMYSASGYIPPNLFKNNTKLKSAYLLFYGCSDLSTAVNLSNMFLTTPNLTSVQEMFSGCKNALIKLDNWFENCPNLTNVRYAFNDCKNLIGSLTEYPHIIAGKSKLTNAEYMFSGCSGLTGDLPSDYFSGCTALKNINGHFNGCSGITGSIRTSIWSDCNNIETCASLFNGCTGLGGIAGEMQEIPRDFFRGKFNLTDASYMFNRCENLTFALMPEKENDNPWFVDCRKLFKINGIFANCKQCYSAIPSRLFEVWDNNGNPIDTFMTEASGVFSGCSLLVDEIPENLFDKFIKVRDLSNFFNGCVNLTGGIPDKLFANCYSLAYVDGMFQNCVKLGRYVEDITEQSPYFCSEELLWNCTNLVSASSMFDMGANGTRLRGEIPPLLFRTCSKLSQINGIFGWCSLLTGTLDAQLFANNGNLTNVNNAFRGCSGLNEISGLLFSNSKNPKITNFDETFRGCGNLTGSAPTLWSQFANAEGLYCFNGCTKLDNYDEIPEQWK